MTSHWKRETARQGELDRDGDRVVMSFCPAHLAIVAVLSFYQLCFLSSINIYGPHVVDATHMNVYDLDQRLPFISI